MSDTHGWIWPKDPRPGNPPHWPRRWRWLDLLTNRGPDIFVGRLRADVDRKKTVDTKGTKANPTPTRWSRWELDHNNNDNQNDNESNIHPAFRSKPLAQSAQPRPKPKRKEHKSPFPWARRRSSERYDFRTKRYCIPDSGTWSRVQYCSADVGADDTLTRQSHVIPMRYWDRDGNEYPAGYWHDVVYGGHAGCDRGRCHGGK